MLSNPDTALPLYVLVVITGIMLGKGWRSFLTQVTASSQAAAATTTGSAAMTGGPSRG
jgi:hypothetical protein